MLRYKFFNRSLVFMLFAISPGVFFAPNVQAQQGTQGPKWSPDGKKITFAARGIDGEDWEIFIVDADGRNFRQLTKNDYTDIQPTFSNDGSVIYYTAQMDETGVRGRDWNIASIEIEGGDAQFAFGERGLNEYHPKMLPNGKVAFSQRRRSDPYDSDFRQWDPITDAITYLIDEPSMTTRTGLFEIKVTAPAAGEEIFFSSRRSGRHEVYSANIDGGNVRQISASFRPVAEPDWLGNAAPSISADGRYLVYWSDQIAPEPFGFMSYVVLDRETGEVIHLPKENNNINSAFPAMRPDGSKIAYPGALGEDPSGLWGIFVQDIKSGETELIWRQSDVTE